MNKVDLTVPKEFYKQEKVCSCGAEAQFFDQASEKWECAKCLAKKINEKKDKAKRVNITIPESLHSKAVEYAQKHDIKGFSTLVQIALEEKLGAE